MKVLSEIPPLLRGRGSPQAIAIECDCKEKFLWSFITDAMPVVICPTCRGEEVVPSDAPILNGQMK